ncbi:nitroreductase family protein [Ruminococcaceae bacterium OttesenSCG-928-I18]|nr:nitroreductase family protein [Ruminococcaceae bacterium OttesenSCG-928-I18]
METMEAIAKRHSSRGFTQHELPEEALDIILRAGCAAPVGMGEYASMHLTVIQDETLLKKITEAGGRANGDPSRDIFYGAPTVVLISSSGGELPELALANAGCIAENMMLAATDRNVQSVYVWGAVMALREEPGLKAECGLPEGFEPVASVALGYEKQLTRNQKNMEMTIEVNRV